MSAVRYLRRYRLRFEAQSGRAWARRGAVVLVAIGGIGVACAPSRINPPAATQLVVTGSEFKFQSSTNRVATGQPVTISFENKGHDRAQSALRGDRDASDRRAGPDRFRHRRLSHRR